MAVVSRIRRLARIATRTLFLAFRRSNKLREDIVNARVRGLSLRIIAQIWRNRYGQPAPVSVAGQLSAFCST